VASGGDERGLVNVQQKNRSKNHPKILASRLLVKRLLPLTLALIALSAGLYALTSLSGRKEGGASGEEKVLRIVSYSAFVNEWGPGPKVAELFEKEYGLKVEYHDAGDAGLILKKLDLVPADAVIGFDQLTLPQARESRKWREVVDEESSKQIDPAWRQKDFVAFDWAPLAFVYRSGEIDPPHGFADLLDPRFRKSIAIQDPRTSTPGLQLLYWILDEYGVDGGFDYLAKLKPNIHSVSGSWSAAYGLFTKKEAKLAFSYLTSPIYHWTEENDRSYAPAVFSSGHAVQVEYAGVPDTCSDCVGGRLFALFLLRPEVQSLIMARNYMLPVVRSVAAGTSYEQLPHVTLRPLKSLPELIKKRESILERWRSLEL
jgi:thiamine transport system substrate-binding protein